ncbi:hypothetical protein [Maridesulfovibrio zosterae]|uniref:hypothetical protein n=1 Tax=Maridesulfovibrio zosterae TaxID=82171 RepID=UPI0004010FE2|nr:hypothetical protein [Maridesulfovibrio zosterae]
MKKQTAATVTNAIDAKSEEARKDALFEIRSLKKDLAQLEKELSSKKSEVTDPAFDLVHSAFEIFRHTQVMAENRKLNQQIDESLEKASFKDYLDGKGARVLKKPEGWHWISPAGEMHYLGEASETQAAAEKLESIITTKRNKPKVAKPSTPKAAPKKIAPKKVAKSEESKDKSDVADGNAK